MRRNHVFKIQSIWEVKGLAGNWKKSVGEFIDTANEAMSAANKAVDTASGVLNVANDAREIYRHYENRRSFRDSEEGKAKLAKAERIDEIGEVVFKMNVIIIFLMIVITIALCVTGNDILLRLLHI